jgi:hypothetical protein
LRQTDQARSDFAAIADDVDLIKAQLARVPTRKDLARTALQGVFAGAALTTVLMLAFWH